MLQLLHHLWFAQAWWHAHHPPPFWHAPVCAQPPYCR